jgi:hypothetical protein
VGDFESLYIYIYREREREKEGEIRYDAMRSTDGLCAMDRFSVFKVQMINPAGKCVFYMKIESESKFYIF